jgi:uncharacterized protein GlcG (DUF336 family)
MSTKASTRTRAILCGACAFLLTVALFALFSPPSSAQNQPGQGQAAMRGMDAQPGQPQTVKDITADQAHAVLAAAMQKATEISTKMDIAVVDAGGNLKAFIRMDGAWLGSIDIAIKKAKTARYFDMPTGEIGKLSQPGKPLYQIEVSNGGLITFPGGVPIKLQDGTIIGAIGVSGSTVESDHACASAGAAVIK